MEVGSRFVGDAGQVDLLQLIDENKLDYFLLFLAAAEGQVQQETCDNCDEDHHAVVCAQILRGISRSLSPTQRAPCRHC